MRLSPLFCALVSAIAFIQPTQGTCAEVPWTIDWSGGKIDQPVSKDTAPNFTSAPVDPDHRVMIVGRNSEVPNPFPDIEKALLLERGNSAGKVPILRWTLDSEGRSNGSFQVQFVMPDGNQESKQKALRFYIGSLQKRNGRPHYPNAGHIRVLGNGVAFLPASETTKFLNSKVKPVEGINTLKIEWDVTNKRGFWASLNGEAIRVNGETSDGPTIIPIPSELCTSIGSVTVMLMYPESKAFIGKITAE